MTATEGVSSGQRPYSAYQDSGVPWIGEIPVGWGMQKIKTICQLDNGFVFPPDSWAIEGTPIIRIENFANKEKFNYSQLDVPKRHHVSQGDLLFSWSASLGPYIWDAPGDYFLNQHIFKVVSHNNKKWLYYNLLAAAEFLRTQMHGSAMTHITRSKLDNIFLAVPPAAVQQAIGDFLDRETARIGELLREQEGLLEDLALRRAALIFEGTTKGLGGDPLRDSGAAWAGQVPAHWEFVKLRSVARLESGHTPSRSKPEYWENCTIPWVSLSDVRRFRDGRLKYIEETEEKISELGMANSAARLLPRGTVILSRTASVGFSAILGTDMATTQDFANWVCGPRLRPEYLLYVLRGMRHEFARLMMGSTHQTIYMPDIRELQVPLPPPGEQQAIVAHLDAQLAQIDALTGEVRASIALMRQHRSALITAAVTGKIDVRGEHV